MKNVIGLIWAIIALLIVVSVVLPQLVKSLGIVILVLIILGSFLLVSNWMKGR